MHCFVILVTIVCTLCGIYLFLVRENQVPSANHSLPVIIWWTPSVFPHFLNDDSDSTVILCASRQCVSTKNRRYPENLTNAGHRSSRILTYAFYGTDLRAEDLPLATKAVDLNLWALVHEESPMNNFLLSQNATIELFNFTATFSRHSDYPLTTLHVPNFEYLFRRTPVPLDTKNKLRSTIAPVLYVQSNCDVSSDRDSYVAELVRHIPIDSLGKCLRNKPLLDQLNSVDADYRHDAKEFVDLIANYKFHLAFENAICDDYVTEKLFRALHVGSIPIYRGSKTVQDWIPSSWFIAVDDLLSPRELAKLIVEIDSDDVRYQQFLQFKTSSTGDDPMLDGLQLLKRHLNLRPWSTLVDDDLKSDFVTGYECFICERMHEIQEKSNLGGGQPEMRTSKIANSSHLGCHEPGPSLSNGTITSNLQEWIDNYRYSSKIAEALRNMIKIEDYDSSKVHLYAANINLADKDEL